MALGYRTPWEVYSARRRPRAKRQLFPR